MGIFLNQSNLVAMGLSLSCSVIADSLQLMDCCIRLPCLSPSPGACSIWQCYPTISSSVLPFSSCLQSVPASGSFPISQFFASCSQSIGASASASVLPINVQDQFPLWLTELISLQSKGLSRVFYSITVQKASVPWCSAFYMVQLSHPYMTIGKTIASTIQTFVGKVIMSLLFNRLSCFLKAFFPMRKLPWILWLQSPSAVILELKKIKHCNSFC